MSGVHLQKSSLAARGLLGALLVVSFSFLAGGALGIAVSSLVGGPALGALQTYLSAYVSATTAGAAVPASVLAVVWQALRWPLAALALGLVGAGVVGIPLLLFLRGFLFTFAAAAFTQIFGTAGAVLAFASFGLTGFLAIPVLFVLGVRSFLAASAQLFRAPPHRFGTARARVTCYGLCAAALTASILLEYSAVPALLRVAVRLF